MRIFLFVILAALFSFVSVAEAPAPDTVAGCSTDWECENGPEPVENQ
jgi:hypothetical protein